MIKRVLLSTLAALLIYSWFIYQFGSLINRTGQTTEQRNMVKAEEYLYEASSRYDTVIVGSSMGDRLAADSLPKGFYNLSLGGLSAIEGLRLIKFSGNLPRVIVVEVNTLTRQEPAKLIETMTDPVWSRMKAYLPFTRQKYQPAGVFKALLRDWSVGRGKTVTPESAMQVDTAFLNKMVAHKMVEANQPPPDSLITLAMQIAYKQLEELRQKGVQIVFFEMPVDSRLQGLPIYAKVRQAAHRFFKEPSYTFVELPHDAYQTTDGVHLTFQESNRFTSYMRRQMPGGISGPYLVKKE